MRRCQIVGDVGMGEIEIAAGIETIALLGNRQRDHPRRRRGQICKNISAIVGRKQRATDGAHHAISGRPVQHLDRVKAILHRHGVRRRGMAQRYAHDAPIAAGARDRIVRKDGLMGAMKCAEPKMHNTDAKPADVVLRPPHAVGKTIKHAHSQPGSHRRYADLARP